MMRKVQAGLVAFFVACAPAVAQAQDAATQVVEALDAGLIATMKAPGGQQGRARVIAPVLERCFDIPLMTRLSVGPAWNTFSAADQRSVINGFRAMMVAQYAANFDGYSGEKITVTGPVEVRGADKFVRTMLVSKDVTESINYRLRDAGGGQWKVIDVHYRNAISQLATRRSDFASVVAKGGAQGLIAHLNRLAANPK